MLKPNQLAALYEQACIVDIEAFKPGNVSIYAEGHGMMPQDFRTSAEVSAPILTNFQLSLGERIFYAVKATRDAVNCNTNLGIILLCAPLLQAANKLTGLNLSLHQAVAQSLANTTIEDANWTFRAISLAAPGGLGEAENHDVHQVATITLSQAMTLAAHRDQIANQYATSFKDIFEFGVLRYNAWLSQWKDPNWAAVFLYADWLAQYPDSHIERKHGNKYTKQVTVMMRQFLDEFGLSSDSTVVKPMLYQLDAEFKSAGVNPGTTADMTVATILSALIEAQLLTKSDEFSA